MNHMTHLSHSYLNRLNVLGDLIPASTQENKVAEMLYPIAK